MTAFLLVPSLPPGAREVTATAARSNVQQIVSAELLCKSGSGRIVICHGAWSSRRSGPIRFCSEKSKATLVRLVQQQRHIGWNAAACFLRKWQWCIDRWGADAKACEVERLTWIGCSATLLGWSWLSSYIDDSTRISFLRTLFASRMTGAADSMRSMMLHSTEFQAADLAAWSTSMRKPCSRPCIARRDTYTQQSASHRSID